MNCTCAVLVTITCDCVVRVENKGGRLHFRQARSRVWTRFLRGITVKRGILRSGFELACTWTVTERGLRVLLTLAKTGTKPFERPREGTPGGGAKIIAKQIRPGNAGTREIHTAHFCEWQVPVSVLVLASVLLFLFFCARRGAGHHF